MRFKHGKVHLVPYPYICTVYLELNSFQQNVSCGEEVNKGSDELVKRRKEVSESPAVEGRVKRRRVEVGAETSCPQSGMDRTGAECVHHRSKAKPGFETVSYRIFRRRQQHLFSPGFLKWQASKCFQNSSKEKECEFSPASLTVGCNQVSFCK
ncbi:uncharacterized protein WM294_011055 [Sarcoramphus papa]